MPWSAFSRLTALSTPPRAAARACGSADRSRSAMERSPATRSCRVTAEFASFSIFVASSIAYAVANFLAISDRPTAVLRMSCARLSASSLNAGSLPTFLNCLRSLSSAAVQLGEPPTVYWRTVAIASRTRALLERASRGFESRKTSKFLIALM